MAVWALEIAVLLICMHRALQAHPVRRRLKKCQKASIFHLPLLAVWGKKAKKRIAQHHIGRNGQGKKVCDSNDASDEEKDNQQKESIRIESGSGPHKLFQSTSQSGIISISCKGRGRSFLYSL